ncbi:MAG: cytochrome c biogenesis CcdA family protein [Leptospirillia bacterium]
MPDTGSISLFIAFSAGFLSFVSPCVLPLLPSYVSFITGLSIEQLTDAEDTARVKRIVLVNSLLFVAGFSTIFMLLGASATFLGHLLLAYQNIVSKVAGIIVIVFGLYVMGVFKGGWMMADKRVHLDNKPKGYIGSYLVGLAFAAGWTPCVGPILGGILLMASTSEGMLYGMVLLASYSLGLGLPFLLTSLALNTFMSRFTAFSRHMRTVSIVSGVLLICIGILIFFNAFTLISSFFTSYGIGWTIEPI